MAKRSRPSEGPPAVKQPLMPDFCNTTFGNTITVRNDSGKRLCVSVDNGRGWPWAVLAPDDPHTFTTELASPLVTYTVLIESRGSNAHLKGDRPPEGGCEADADGSTYKVVFKGKKELELIKVGENGSADPKPDG